MAIPIRRHWAPGPHLRTQRRDLKEKNLRERTHPTFSGNAEPISVTGTPPARRYPSIHPRGGNEAQRKHKAKARGEHYQWEEITGIGDVEGKFRIPPKSNVFFLLYPLRFSFSGVWRIISSSSSSSCSTQLPPPLFSSSFSLKRNPNPGRVLEDGEAKGGDGEEGRQQVVCEEERIGEGEQEALEEGEGGEGPQQAQEATQRFLRLHGGV